MWLSKMCLQNKPNQLQVETCNVMLHVCYISFCMAQVKCLLFIYLIKSEICPFGWMENPKRLLRLNTGRQRNKK